MESWKHGYRVVPWAGQPWTKFSRRAPEVALQSPPPIKDYLIELIAHGFHAGIGEGAVQGDHAVCAGTAAPGAEAQCEDDPFALDFTRASILTTMASS